MRRGITAQGNPNIGFHLSSFPEGTEKDTQKRPQRVCRQKRLVLWAGQAPQVGRRESQRQTLRSHTQRNSLQEETQPVCFSGGLLELLR